MTDTNDTIAFIKAQIGYVKEDMRNPELVGPDAALAAACDRLDSVCEALDDIANKDAEIARLKAQLEGIRVARDEAQAVLSMLNADPAVATFQIASHFQVMGNKVGRILLDGQS